MRTKILLPVLFCLLGMSLVHSQTQDNKEPDPKLQVKQLVIKEMTYPEFAVDLGIEGVVFASFSVNEDSTLKVIEVNSANDRLREYVDKKLKEIKVSQVVGSDEVFNMKFTFELL